MRLLRTSTDAAAIEAALTQTNTWDRPDIEAGVRQILRDVRERGDEAVRDCLRRFDGVELETFAASPEEFAEAERRLDPDVRRAMDRAAARIAEFHRHAIPASWQTDHDGAVLGQRVTPLARVGVHAPAGQAPLPSTVLMTAIPAREAGVPEVVVCSAPRRDGSVTSEMLYAAQLAGAQAFYKIGGPAAIAAMTFGTEQIPAVDKIVGPGSPYTVMAKRLVFGLVGIESLPGPTEIVVIADESANAAWIAADLLSQAEHAEDSLVVLLTPSDELAKGVIAEVEQQLTQLTRQEIARACVEQNGYAIVTRDLAEACELSNRRAPEHVELIVADPDAWIDRLTCVGAVFVGPYSSEPVGDYLAGPSHVLPTGGTARFASPLNVTDFVKRTTVLRYSRERFLEDAADVIAFAEAEGLTAHAHAIRIRLEDEAKEEQ